MHYSVIFDEKLLEQRIEEVRLRALSLNENELTSKFKNTYNKEVFGPLYTYLEESFFSGLIKKGKNFVDKFTQGAKEIAQKVGKAIKEFSFKKIFATITKLMNKIKAKALKGLMILLEPLRAVIISNKFSDENNKFSIKVAFDKLISVAKEAGKEVEADKILDDNVVSAIEKNANLEGVALAESIQFLTEDEAEEKEKGRATFDEKDVKYMAFFQKMLFKLGVKGTKLNGILAEISKKITQGAAITGIISILGAILPSMGIVSAIAGAVGAAIAAAPVLVMLIGAVLFGIGLFMFATWLLQPYPTIQNCRIFLSTIFAGSNPFDYPETPIGSFDTVPMDNVKPRKPVFDFELIQDLEKEGVEEEIPGGGSDNEVLAEEADDIIKIYDELDIDTLEDDKEVEDNKRIARIFVRNIFSKSGRDKIQDAIEGMKEDEEDNEYTESLETFVSLVDDIFISDAFKEEDEDGKKAYPYALSYQSVQDFLKSKSNSVADRMTKVIDVTDNFIDRIDKINKKDKDEK
jgi:hypothetical protein